MSWRPGLEINMPRDGVATVNGHPFGSKEAKKLLDSLIPPQELAFRKALYKLAKKHAPQSTGGPCECRQHKEAWKLLGGWKP